MEHGTTMAGSGLRQHDLPSIGADRALSMEERLHALETENTNLRRAWHEAESRLAYLTDLYEHAPVACLRLDRDGAIRDANHAVAMLLGVPKAALLHLSLYRFLTVEIQQQLRQWLADVMRSGLSQSNEFAFQTSTRHALHLLVEASSDRNRQTCRLSLIDISARKRAERRIAQTELFANRFANRAQNLAVEKVHRVDGEQHKQRKPNG